MKSVPPSNPAEAVPQRSAKPPGLPPLRAWLGLGLLLLVVQVGSAYWRDAQAAKFGPELARLARPGDIQMVSSLSCGYCERARHWLTQQQVPFTECFVEREATCAARYQAWGAAGTPSVWVRGELQLGFDAQRVRDQLAGLPLRAATDAALTAPAVPARPDLSESARPRHL